ncbi:MAG: DNA polymerase III subunit delta [Clostridiales bacterium]|jgi:DNA polymerase III delta subunit|nr:DNA polymerase III subunit delta [Clostridiales bacterium]
MKFVELNQHISSGKLMASYHISGDDLYLVEHAIKQFGDIVQLPEFNKTVLHTPSMVDLCDTCNSLPIGSQYKLVVAYNINIKSSKKSSTTRTTGAKGKNIGSNKVVTEQQLLLQYILAPNPSTILLLIDSDIGPEFKNYIIEIDCKKLEESTLMSWVLRECNKKKCDIDKDANRLLIQYCNCSMLRISTEVAKLCAYTKTISSQDVVDIVSPDTTYQIFELSQAVSCKDIDKAIAILNYCVRNGEEPVMLLGMLYSHFRRLMCVSLNFNDNNLANYLGVKEYAVTKLKHQSKQFGVGQLRNILNVLWDIDQDFRAGKLPLDLAVEYAILKIS